MQRHTQALLFCLLFVLLAEVAARAIVHVDRPGAPGASDRTRCVLLGASRTMRGLRPAIIEQTLAEQGVPDVWVTNVSQRAIKYMGLHQLYMEQIHPLAAAGVMRGVLAISVSASALNDNTIPPEERVYGRLAGIDVPPQQVAQPRGPLRATLEDLRAGEWNGAARTLLGALQLSQGREPLSRAVRGRIGGAAPDATKPDEPTWTADWAREEKGWLPFSEPRQDDLKVHIWERRYRGELLKDYEFGGRQTYAIIHLIRQVRADGFEPVLYIMPITDIQVGFFGPGEFEAGLRHLYHVAESEQVPLIDLHTGHGLSYDLFYDTHHLDRRGVGPVSRRFATEVLLPLLQ